MSIPKGLSAVVRSYFLPCPHAGFNEPIHAEVRKDAELAEVDVHGH